MLGCALRNGSELQVATLEDSLRETLHKVEDTSRCLLVLAEGLVVHKEVDNLALRLRKPSGILVGSEWILIPTLIREAECDIVRKLVVAEQETKALICSTSIDEVRRLPSKDMLCTLGQHSLEAEFANCLANLVRVDKLGVAECLWLNTELLLEHCGVLLDLILEILLRRESCQRVRVGLGQQLYATGVDQCAERIEHLWSVSLELLNNRTCERECHTECTLVLLDELQKERVHWQVALACNLEHNCTIGQIVKVVVILADVEKAVGLQSPRLMYLKI